MNLFSRKRIQEREQEAKEFFQSESEEEKESEATTTTDNAEPAPNPEPEKTSSELLQEIDAILTRAEDNYINSTTAAVDLDKHDEPPSATVIIESAPEVDEQPPSTDNTAQESTNLDPPAVVDEAPPEQPQPSTSTSDAAERKNARKSKLLSLIGELPTINPTVCDDNALIDLETGDIVKKELTGPELLMQKYVDNACKKVSSQQSQEVDLEIVSLSQGLHTEHIRVKRDPKPFVLKDLKPGASYMKLKASLEQKIHEKRKEEVMKREEYTKKIEEEQATYSNDEDEVIDSETEDVDELEKVEETIEPTEVEQNPEIDDNDSSDSSSSDEEGACEADKPRKGRIIAAFEDSDDPDDAEKITETSPKKSTMDVSLNSFDPLDINLEKPSDDHSVTILPWEDDEGPANPDDDLLALCSGKFSTQIQPSANPLQKLFNDVQTQPLNEDELSALCSGRFTTQASPAPVLELEKADDEPIVDTNNKHEVRRPVILSSDEEDDATRAESSQKKIKRRKKRRRQVLEISDDESDEVDEPISGEGEVGDYEEVEVEEAETYIDYDSEENEVQVKMTKKDRLKKAEAYFENEAELSGSEYGSADEDEANLDEFEKELGDDDVVDLDTAELERIHMAKLMDQDSRDIKRLKEMFFEDEENDGVGRTRKFMWKNLDLNIELPGAEDIDNNGDNAHAALSDEESEEQVRKMRYEREQLLKLSEGNNSNDAEGSVATTKQRKLTIVKGAATTPAVNTGVSTDSPFLIAASYQFKELRASFLARPEEDLNKLALMVKEKEADAIGSKAVTNSRNMVFQTITPPPKEKVPMVRYQLVLESAAAY